jgi:hypothetical protein
MTERVRYKYHTVRCIIETSIGSLIVQTIKASYSPGHRINMERERARYIERETTYSGLQEHWNTNDSTEKALEH